MQYRICVSLVERTPERMLQDARAAAAKGADLVEFRLDAIPSLASSAPADAAELARRLLREAPPSLGLVFTARTKAEGGINPLPEETRKAVAAAVLRSLETPAGGLFLDAERDLLEWTAAEKRGASSPALIIGSVHDFDGVPGDVPGIVRKLRSSGADIVKLAVTPSCAAEAGRLLAFFRELGFPFILAGMGPAGTPLRLLSPLFGAVFTFAALEEGREAAPGQVSIGGMLDVFGVRSWSAGTAVLGVAGNPVGHSLSPLLHNAVFRERRINALYLPFQVTGDPADFLEAWAPLGLYGCSVTIPHKVRALEICPRKDPAARRIGAANTLKRLEDGSFAAFNTDAPAAVDSVRAAAGDIRGRTVLILGAGGAARAAAVGFLDAGCRVVVSNRTHSKAVALARETGCGTVPFEQRASAPFHVLVNATSVGMTPETDASPIPPEAIRPGTVVMDMVYNPLRTRLLRDAEAKDAVTVPGTEMFIRQAARQLEIWFGIDAPLELLREVLLEALETD